MMESKILESELKSHVFLMPYIQAFKYIPDQAVQLIYLDPPFLLGRKLTGTGSSVSSSFDDVWDNPDPELNELYNQFRFSNPLLHDNLSSLEHWPDVKHYLIFMAAALLECRRVLKLSGTIWLHCNDKAKYYLKVILDIIFGRENFKNEIILRIPNTARGWGKFSLRKTYETIFYYTRDKQHTKFYHENNLIKSAPLHRNPVVGLKTGTSGKGYVRKQGGKAKFLAWDVKTRKYTFLTTLTDIWGGIRGFNHAQFYFGRDLTQQQINATNRKYIEIYYYPTQKSLSLLRRIIKLTTVEGDLVLDPFMGSGTTLIAAAELNRRWVGFDKNLDVKQIFRKRLFDVSNLITRPEKPIFIT